MWPILCTLQVGILDDDIFEEDEHFFVRLQNLRLEEGGNEGTGSPPRGRLVEPLIATITILDDDHAGIFTFGQRVLRVSESTGTLILTVLRNSGSRGTVAVPYHTEDGSAKAGLDYEETRGELEFTNERTRSVPDDAFPYSLIYSSSNVLEIDHSRYFKLPNL